MFKYCCNESHLFSWSYYRNCSFGTQCCKNVLKKETARELHLFILCYIDRKNCYLRRYVCVYIKSISTLFPFPPPHFVQTVSDLIRMYLGQHNHPAAVSLFMESLQHGYSLEPPDQLLTSVCEAMEKTNATHNLYTVVKLLIDRGISVCKSMDKQGKEGLKMHCILTHYTLHHKSYSSLIWVHS